MTFSTSIPWAAVSQKYLLNPLDIATDPTNDHASDPSRQQHARPYARISAPERPTSLLHCRGTSLRPPGCRQRRIRILIPASMASGSCTVLPDENIQEYPAISGSNWRSVRLDDFSAGEHPCAKRQTKSPASVPFYLTTTPAPAAVQADDWGVLWSKRGSEIRRAKCTNTRQRTGPALSNYPLPPTLNYGKHAYPASPQSPYGQISGELLPSWPGERDRRGVERGDRRLRLGEKQREMRNRQGARRRQILHDGGIRCSEASGRRVRGLISEATLTTEIKLYK